MSTLQQGERLTADAFLAQSAGDDRRLELIDGFVVRMMTEKRSHARAKRLLARQLLDQISEDAPRTVYLDGMAVRLSETDVYEPDLMIQCGGEDDDSVYIDDPTIIIEILSPSTRTRDFLVKAPRYLAAPSVTHVLLVDTDKPGALLYARDAGADPAILPPDAALRLPLAGGEILIELAPIFDTPA